MRFVHILISRYAFSTLTPGTPSALSSTAKELIDRLPARSWIGSGSGRAGPRWRSRSGGTSAEDIGAAPMLLDVEGAGLLPGVVLKGEEDDLGADDGLDALDGGRLLGGTRAGGAVAVAGVGPAGLHDVDVLAGADALEDGDLGLDEGPGLVAGGGGVEEGVQVGRDHVDGGAEGGSYGLPG